MESWRSVTVLAVEDDMTVAALVGAVLDHDRRFRCVHHATTVAAARAVLAVHAPDVVLLDHDLPDGTAADVVRALHDARCGAPVVLHSARDDLHERAHDLHCACAVPKSQWQQLPELLVRLGQERPDG